MAKSLITTSAAVAIALTANAHSQPHAEEGTHESHAAHVHGAWQFLAAQDGDQLSVTLSGPLVDLLGFENPPQNDQEHAALAALKTRLAASEVLFELSKRANCTPSSEPQISLPAHFDDGQAQAAPAPSNAKTTEHHDDHDHHAQHDQDHRAHDQHDNHHASDIELTYVFKCAAPARIKAVTMTAFESFPAIETVDAAFLSDQNQTADRLSAQKAVLKLN